MLVKDFEGNVFLTNTYRFNSKNVKSAVRLGLAIIDNYALTEAAHSDFFFSDYFGFKLILEQYSMVSASFIESMQACESSIITAPTSTD